MRHSYNRQSDVSFRRICLLLHLCILSIMAAQEKLCSKIVLFGKSKVGKTLLIKSFKTTNSDDLQVSCNVYIYEYKRNLISLSMQIWDTSDNTGLQTMFPSILLKANIIILVFDTGKPESLSYLMQYIKEINKRDACYRLIVLGHNLTKPKKVAYAGGKLFADCIQAEYIEFDNDLESASFSTYLAEETAKLHCKELIPGS